MSKSQDARPDILRMKPMSYVSGQEIESDVLRPVVFSSDNLFARFELQPKGHLSSSSSISFSLKPNAGVERAFVPPNIGIHSLIDRAVLRTSSGRVICDQEEFGHFSSLKSMLKDNDIQTQREQFLSGRDMDYELHYGSNVGALYYGLSNGREYTQSNILHADDKSSQGKASVNGLGHHNFQYITTQDSRTTLSPSYSIVLHDLFPFLKSGNRLPLFMFESDRIQIELYFTAPKQQRVCVTQKLNGAALEETLNQEFLIDQNSVELISDHIFYPTQSLAQMKDAEPSEMPYFDYQLSRQTITSDSADATKDTAKTNTRNVGGASRVITRVFSAYVPTGNQETTILNKYKALAMTPTAKQSGELDSNLFFNERFLYPLNIKNNARHFFNLYDTDKRHYHTSREVYSNSGTALMGAGSTDYQYEGRVQSTNLAGSQFWQGFRLNVGERIGTKGIDIHMNARGVNGDGSGLPDGSYTQYVYLETMRTLTMDKNTGQIEVLFS
tara:strand:+ start:1773 stop:3269 length:1497 start_codon:yes stop_codon:yes gene_type:complete